MPDRTIPYAGTYYTVTAAHPAADALPWLLDSDEFRDIVASIAAYGFDPEKPIYRQQATGRIVCGRRRELAARVAKVAPAYRDVDWTDGQVFAFVERDELHRRHLTPSEKAASVVSLRELRRSAGGDGTNQHSGRNSATSPNSSEPASKQGETRGDVAKHAGIGERTVRAAATVKEMSAELFEAVKEGQIGAQLAEKLAKTATPKQIEKVVAAEDVAKAARAVLAPKQPKADPPTSSPPPPATSPKPTTEGLKKCPHCHGSGYVPARVELLRNAPGMPDIPDSLDTEAFRDSWEEWLRYRKKRKPAVNPDGAMKQLKDLARFPPAVGIEAIEAAIRNGYQGLFPEKINGHGPGKTGGRPGRDHNPSRVTAAPGDFADAGPDLVVE